MRARIAGEVLERRVGHAAVLADVLVGFLALEEDVLPLAAETVWAAIAQKCLGVGIFCSASLAVDRGGLWRGGIARAFVRGFGCGQTKNGTDGKNGRQQKISKFHRGVCRCLSPLLFPSSRRGRKNAPPGISPQKARPSALEKRHAEDAPRGTCSDRASFPL